MITFCRLRPAGAVTEIWATTHRREGSTSIEVAGLGDDDRAGALAGGMLPVEIGAGTADPAAWVADPAQVLRLSAMGIAGWRLTVADTGDADEVLDAAVRSGAAFLRTGRSRVAEAFRIASLPGVSVAVSVFVDTIDEALAAVRAGAGDLLLRDWDTASIGALRDSLASRLLAERTAFPVGVGVDSARDELDPGLFRVYLDLVDGRGMARPRGEWAPGKDLAPPVPPRRHSAEWADAAWVNDDAGSGAIRLAINRVLEKSLEGTPPDRDEVELLFTARGAEVDVVAGVADQLRRRANGDTVTYVINRNINYTNQCYFRCGFCAFSKGPRSLELRGEPYLLEIHEVVFRAREAWERGATEVCLQGGIHPDFTGEFYVSVLKAIKDVLPEMHVHGFTPLEVWQGAHTLGISVGDFLTRLKAAGLGTLPGTAAEILDDRVRRHLCPDKIRTSQWADVMIQAHEMGLRSTATIMFGHIDDPGAWANHLEVLRQIQRRTGGITEFVPLPFVHMGAPIYLKGRSRPGPTWDEVVLMHAVGRIALDGLIPNVQASWVKLGLEGASRLLDAGCNDLGGTLMDENISRAAGASHGQLASPEALESAIGSAGRVPARRNTLYEIVERGAVGIGPPTVPS